MTPLLRNTLLLGVLLLGGTGLYAWWYQAIQSVHSLHWGSIPPELPSPVNVPVTTHDVAALRETRERPLFWASRRPLAPAMAEQSTTGSLDLLGIVTEKSGRIALVRTGDAKPSDNIRRLHEGETIGVLTLQSIGHDSIILAGPAGLQTLKLKRGGTPLPAQLRPGQR